MTFLHSCLTGCSNVPPEIQTYYLSSYIHRLFLLFPPYNLFCKLNIILSIFYFIFAKTGNTLFCKSHILWIQITFDNTNLWSHLYFNHMVFTYINLLLMIVIFLILIESLWMYLVVLPFIYSGLSRADLTKTFSFKNN